jgi:hypothetical protein
MLRLLFLVAFCAPFLLSALSCASSRPERSDGYASSPSATNSPGLLQTLDGVSCPGSSLRGAGTGKNENDALAQARAAISAQIQSTISAESESYTRQHMTGESESLRSSWEQRVRQTTSLANAHEAKVQYSTTLGGQSGVVACMTRSAAARPFADRYQQLSDSLQGAMLLELTQTHPLKKAEAYRTARSIQAERLTLQGVLQNLGSSALSANASSDSLYQAMLADYNHLRSNYRLAWMPKNNDTYAQAAHQQLSARYRVQGENCNQGLLLVYESPEPVCAPSSLGVSCDYRPTLKGASCQGEPYFSLQGSLSTVSVKGEDDAKSKIAGKLAGADFWNAWFHELDKWKLD